VCRERCRKEKSEKEVCEKFPPENEKRNFQRKREEKKDSRVSAERCRRHGTPPRKRGEEVVMCSEDL